MIKRKLLAFMLVISMTLSGMSGFTVQAEESDVVEEETMNIENDGESENVDATSDISEESVTNELVIGDEAVAEEVTEEIEEPEYAGFVPGTVTVVDENGNIYEVDAEDGDASEIAVSPRVRSASGLIVNFNTQGTAVTNYTEYETGVSGYTCGAYGADAAYLGMEDGKVKFMLSGVIGLVSTDYVQLVDVSTAASVSYYVVDTGRLYHKITTNVTKSSYASTLDNGVAPSYLKAGTKYYSYDGHYFYTMDKFSEMLADYSNGTRDNSVNPNSPYYNYFQYLPLRSQSNYSASELNTIVNGRVSSSSQLLNQGTTFVNYQNTYGTNALLMVGIAANESSWGTSNIALTKNNLFGLNAVDSSPGESANYYSNVASCIKDFSETYLSKQYLNPNDWKCFGAFLGNKASGMNVKYASDPYWGEKAANMAYALDKTNGNKDYLKYTIGIKDLLGSDHTSLNVRSGATTSSTKIYTTSAASQYAFLILDNETNYSGFYRVQSEPVLNSGRTAINSSSGEYSFNNMYTYVSTSYITIVSEGSNSASSDITVNTGSVEKITVPSAVTSALTVTPYAAAGGWASSVNNGVQAGTIGKSLQAVKFNINGISNLGIEYSAHVSNVGWQSYVSNGAVAGTTDTSEKIEALKIRLTGTKSTEYSLYYRVYVSGAGWQSFVSDDEIAGTTGLNTAIEAVQVILLAKEKDITTDNKSIINYSTYIPTIGWGGSASENGEQSGTVGMSYGIQSLKITTNLDNLGVEYTTHIPDIGWQSFVEDGAESKVTNEPKRIEAIRIRLTGIQANNYDIYYRTHVANLGWLDWAKNGEMAGTSGYAYQVEAIQIVVVKKGSSAPGSTSSAFQSKYSQQLTYAAYVNGKGWQSTVKDGATAGTTGQARTVGAIKISISNKLYTGSVQYSGHLQNIGWDTWKSEGSVSGGVTGSTKYEAIKIRLTDEMAEYYDIYYRVHVANIGWLGWAKNGEAAGSEGYAYPMEAIEIKLVKKDGAAPGTTENCFILKGASVQYSAHVSNIGWQSYVKNGVTGGTVGRNLQMEALKIQLADPKYDGDIVYSVHVEDIGWMSSVKNGAISGTVGKNKQIEAIKISLTGELAENCDVYYRVHSQDFGWLAWTKNGAAAGSEGYAKQVEAIQIKIVTKGENAPSTSGTAFYKK